jgi:hypothetical protein
MPAKHNLSGAFVVLIGKLSEDGFLKQATVTMTEWIPTHQACSVLFKAVSKLTFGKVRMKLYLSNVWGNFCLSEKSFELFTIEI